MGRFLNEDTYEGQITNPLTLNNYAYVNNNPLIYVDPTGHITESYNDGALRYLLKDIRAQVNSKSSPLYSKAKAKVTEIYGNFTDENTYNYLFDLTTKTSTYGNSDGKSDWAIEQLVSGYQAYVLDEYLATMAAGSMGGAVGPGGNKGKVKGTEFRGGKKKDRDKWYGYNNKDFQKWWEKQGKKEWGGADIQDGKMAKEVYDAWLESGKPKVK